MRIQKTATADKAFANAPARVQRAFLKQVGFLQQNLLHPSLHAKKYDETGDLWQARVDLNWRFYFLIHSDIYLVTDIIPHPKR